jgi:hypothetical protein
MIGLRTKPAKLSQSSVIREGFRFWPLQRKTHESPIHWIAAKGLDGCAFGVIMTAHTLGLVVILL